MGRGAFLEKKFHDDDSEFSIIEPPFTQLLFLCLPLVQNNQAPHNTL
jgi:hypothetical protein